MKVESNSVLWYVEHHNSSVVLYSMGIVGLRFFYLKNYLYELQIPGFSQVPENFFLWGRVELEAESTAASSFSVFG